MGTEEQTENGGGVATADDSLTITDNRTGKTYEVPIEDGTIRATALRSIKVNEEDFGVMAYDPAFMNTASCRSAITYLDGEAGRARVPGLSDRAARRALDVPRGRLSAGTRRAAQPEAARRVDASRSRCTPSSTRTSRASSRASATTPTRWACCSPPSARCRRSIRTPTASTIPETRYLQIIRLIAKMPTLAAFAYRHNMGQPYVYPDNDLRYPGNFLSMLFKMSELKYEPDPRLEKALDVLFILHADHEQNCSTSAVRAVGSSQVDPYSAVAAGIAALYGPLHGGANEQVLRMLRRIETKENIPDFIAGREGRQGAPDGLRAPGLQELRPARQDHQEGLRGRLRGHGRQPAARDRHGAREDRARGRVLRQAQALPERRLLLGPDLRGAAHAGRHVHRCSSRSPARAAGSPSGSR